MDEPFDGLVYIFEKLFGNILIPRCIERQMTIFISSHHLNELDSIL